MNHVRQQGGILSGDRFVAFGMPRMVAPEATDLRSLRAKRGNKLEELEALAAKAEAENRDLKGTEKVQWDRIKGELSELDTEIARGEAAEREKLARMIPAGEAGVFADRGRPPAPVEFETPDGNRIQALRPQDSLDDYMRRTGRMGSSSNANAADLGAVVQAMLSGRWNRVRPEIRAAMGEGQNATGGFLVPDVLSSMVIDLARNKSVLIRAGALTIPMDSETLTLARLVGDPTAAFVGENEEIPESEANFDAVNLVARKVAMLVKVSRELADDAANLGAVLSNAMAQAIALKWDHASLYGVKPGIEGLIYNASVNTVSMGANGAAIADYDEFVEALQEIWDANGSEEGLTAVMAPRTRTAFSKLKDTTNQPLMPPDDWKAVRKFASTQVPVDQVQGSAENASDVLVGDWSQLVVGMRTEILLELTRVAGTAFSEHQVWFKATLRLDSAPVRPSHFTRVMGIIP